MNIPDSNPNNKSDSDIEPYNPSDSVPDDNVSSGNIPPLPLHRVELSPISEPVPSTPTLDSTPIQPPPPEESPAEIEPEPVPEEPAVSTPVKPRSEPIEKARVQAPQKQERYTLITFVSMIRSLSVTFAFAVIVATIFMWWTSPDFLSAQTRRELAPVQATAERNVREPTALPTPIWFNRIGIVAGHSGIATYGRTKGQVDPGAVCDADGFTEASVTMNVALKVKSILEGRGFTVDLLEEFDLRLENYKSAALISLHADSCQIFDDGFNHSGFKNAYPINRMTVRDQDMRLDQCLRDNYHALTKLDYKPSEITPDMTEYHAWKLISPTTPATILELGNLHYDRDLLQNRTSEVAVGIVNGLLCYLQPTGQATTLPPPPTRAVVPSPTPVVVPTDLTTPQP